MNGLQPNRQIKSISRQVVPLGRRLSVERREKPDDGRILLDKECELAVEFRGRKLRQRLD